MSVTQCDQCMRGWNIDMVRPNEHVVRDLDHRHGSPASENFSQHALVRRRQVQNHDKGHAAVGGHVVKETMKRVDAAGGGAYANDGKIRATTHRETRQAFKLPKISTGVSPFSG